jgi:hypothetical protein
MYCSIQALKSKGTETVFGVITASKCAGVEVLLGQLPDMAVSVNVGKRKTYIGKC